MNFLCTLEYAMGGIEPCPGETCQLWEDEDCALVPVEREILAEPAVAERLLDLRHEVEGVLARRTRRLCAHGFFISSMKSRRRRSTGARTGDVDVGRFVSARRFDRRRSAGSRRTHLNKKERAQLRSRALSLEERRAMRWRSPER